MTVQKLIDRLAHVAHKSKEIVTKLGDKEFEIHGLCDSHDKLMLFLHQKDTKEAMSGKKSE